MFLDRIATHILAWEGTDENPGNWHWFEATSILIRRTRSNAWAKKLQSPIACIANLRAISVQRIVFRTLENRGSLLRGCLFMLAGTPEAALVWC